MVVIGSRKFHRSPLSAVEMLRESALYKSIIITDDVSSLVKRKKYRWQGTDIKTDIATAGRTRRKHSSAAVAQAVFVFGLGLNPHTLFAQPPTIVLTPSWRVPCYGTGRGTSTGAAEFRPGAHWEHTALP